MQAGVDMQVTQHTNIPNDSLCGLQDITDMQNAAEDSSSEEEGF